MLEPTPSESALAPGLERRDAHPPSPDRALIDTILRRAELSKITRAFKNRLALAAFKAQRGWSDVKLDIIEPHLEQEAQKRKAALHHGAMGIQNGNGNGDTGQMGPPPSTRVKRSRSVAGLPGTPTHEAETSMYDHLLASSLTSLVQSPVPSQPFVPPHFSPHPPPMQPFPPQLQSPSMYAPFQPIASTSALQPPAHQSPYHAQQSARQQSVLGTPQHGNPQAFQNAPSSIDSNRSRGGHEGSYSRRPSPPKATPEFLPGHTSPPRKHASPRSNHSAARNGSIHRPSPGSAVASLSSSFAPSPSGLNPRQRKQQQQGLGNGRPLQLGGPQQPLSSSDPGFSSFVNAATALTGLSHHRTPSGSTVFGPPPPLASPHDLHSRHVPSPHHMYSSTSHSDPHAFQSPSTSSNLIFRPQTPPSGRLMANGAQTMTNGEDPSSTSNTAAELMLFLAASPSPVQTRKRDFSIGNLGGAFGELTALGQEEEEGMSMKGRRLFSGAGTGVLGSMLEGTDEFGGSLHLGSEIFGGMNVGGGSEMERICVVKEENESGTLGKVVPSTTTTTTPQVVDLGLVPTPPTSLALRKSDSGSNNGLTLAPTTPGRDRSVSGGGDWGAFINASPEMVKGGVNTMR